MSKILIHQSPLGALEIVGVPGVVEPGEPFKVDDDTAGPMLEQADLYHVASKAEIKSHADAQKTADDAAASAAEQSAEGENA